MGLSVSLWNEIRHQAIRCELERNLARLGSHSSTAVPRRTTVSRGTDDVDNLFLMCRECHDLAPNTCVPAIFFEWARAQSSYGRELARIRAALHAFGVGDAEARDLDALLNSKEFEAWKANKIGLHRPQSNYAPTTYRLTPATLVGLAVHYRRINAANRPLTQPTCCDVIHHRQNNPACPWSRSRPSADRRRRPSVSRR